MNEQQMNGGQAIVRQAFGEQSIEMRRETTQASMIAQARAQTEAMFIVAKQQPRSWDNVRVRLLDECKRPGFADAAWFRKPQGGTTIQGLSVRFAEAALRTSGNLRRGARTIYDDSLKRQLTIFVVDLETNAWSEQDATIEKTIERKNPNGRMVVGERDNSAGEKVYIVQSTEDELRMKEGALVSKIARNLILQMIPGDILDDCRAQIKTTQSQRDAKDPAAARKALIDAFATIHVMPTDLAQYLSHEIAASSPSEVEDLRGVYAAIRDGETSWQEVITEKVGAQTQQQQPDDKSTSRGARVAARVRGTRGAAETKTEPEPPFGQTQTQQPAGTPAGTSTSASAPSSASTPAGAVSIADERAAKMALEKERLAVFPKEVGVPVRITMAGGQIWDTVTTEMAGMFGDFACVRVEGLDEPMPLSRITMRDREPGDEG